jgi:all-trans-retinol 13,14-reductase
MAKDFLKGARPAYDVVVIGSGLGGLTAANYLAKLGHSVLILEHHYQFGGLATWFTRSRGHIFDISLHGFPVGMIKSCRKYWSPEISNRIGQLHDIRFANPQFQLQTTFDRADFTRLLTEHFGIAAAQVEAFFEHLRRMNYYDRDTRTTRELFEEFFPGRGDVHRLLLEPIAYANGSTLDDPAITYGIVFSNFMSKGVYIFRGGTDLLIGMMAEELRKNGADLRHRCLVERVLTAPGPDGRPAVTGVIVNGREVRCRAVVSNSNIKNTLFDLLGREQLPPAFVAEAEAVRVNTSSCQVYMGIRAGEAIPAIGDLVFTSDAKEFSSEELTAFHTTSRTYSVYYPDTRPQKSELRYAVVASINARWQDWAGLGEADYALHKQRLADESVAGLERFIPGVREKIDWLETATPRTVQRYVRHWGGTSFGTKFEGLKVSMDLPAQVPGLYHAGSVGIIMSGWLGTINYGVITASKVDEFLRKERVPAAMAR